MSATALSCEPTFEAHGFAGRTELILARERRGFGSMTEVLRSGGGKGESADEGPVTVEELERALDSSEASLRYAAAFLAGRCNSGAPARLRAALARVAEDSSMADAAIEAAMSLALLGNSVGDLELAKQRLQRAASNEDLLADPYKAAFFLAQLGDTSGWSAMETTLSCSIPHYRLMALRHVAGFLPFHGTPAAGSRDRVIDVHGRLLAGLQDPDPLVRQEVPFYLEEARTPGLAEALARVQAQDPDSNVRTAAEMVLERLQ